MRSAPWAYFDTSVLLKRYIRISAKRVRRRREHPYRQRYRILSSAITPVETMSALCRRRASGDPAKDDFTEILSRIRKDRSYRELVSVTPLVLSHAEELVQTTGVKTLDALHLASVQAFQAMLGMPIPFTTANVRQRDAASRLDLTVIGGSHRTPRFDSGAFSGPPLTSGWVCSRTGICGMPCEASRPQRSLNCNPSIRRRDNPPKPQPNPRAKRIECRASSGSLPNISGSREYALNSLPPPAVTFIDQHLVRRWPT